MEVYFYTGAFTHTMYREQVRAVPDNVRIIASSGDVHATGMKSDIAKGSSTLFRGVRRLKYQVLRGVRKIGVPNVRYVRGGRADLIHSAQYPLLNRRPWVVDFEDVSVFAWYESENLFKPQVRRVLESLLGGRACRRILPWSEAARQSLLNGLDCDRFAHKITVVHPAIAARERKIPRHDRSSVSLLFVGTNFYLKGGLETLLAFRELRRRLPIELRMVTSVPDDVRREFAETPGLSFHTRVPPDALATMYRDADLFVAPLHTDTFGFVLLEAFAYGIPCIVTDQFAVPEIVRHGVTGLIIPNSVSRFGADRLPQFSHLPDGQARLIRLLGNPPADYVGRLADAIEQLVADPSRRTQMAAAAYEEVTAGRFSVSARRSAMAKVYTDALRTNAG